MNRVRLLEDLLFAVREMRGAQKAFFKTRDRQFLRQSIDAEREVDRIVASIDAQPKGFV